MAKVEMVDIINRDDEVIDTVPRSVMRANLLPHRSTYVAVVDSKGRILVELRTLTKDYAPGFFDACVGGVVQSGEDVHESAARELLEEVGIDVSANKNLTFTHLGKLLIPYAVSDGFVMANLYLCKGDCITSRQKSEVSGIMMLSESELMALKSQCARDSFIAFEEIMRLSRERGLL
ncbi:NUDIX domain-containing protein [Anaerobiospirillum sp. NML120449]|uniref:NUDIX domain-containing protein n=1 Tax=Anaerobiospirillum sp. NML120449 TaxID=2932817 RepID=UPI001FF14901|nr:NUDIX domain-containing protein [Anaerobiospirillum sp. NML120449]MCK0527230.1 NUDIX domain-containing protein [Anaerobiospirillum sp. NML120449]